MKFDARFFILRKSQDVIFFLVTLLVVIIQKLTKMDGLSKILHFLLHLLSMSG